MKTIFCDIDGVLFEHPGHLSFITEYPVQQVLPGVKEKLDEWQSKAYNVILTTGRPESLRRFTEEQLQANSLVYDKLIMGLKRFPRVLINDVKPDGKESATAINLIRDEGMEDLDI